MNQARKEWLLLAATILASGMAFLDGTVVNIAVPPIQESFQATFDAMLWVVNAFPLALASLLMISGSLADRFGRKRCFLIGIAAFTVASALCGIAWSALSLTLFRALQGAGAAMMIPGSLAIINLNVPEERRGRAIGLWSGFSGGLAALGPFVGGWLIEQFSWHAIFFINLPVGFLAFTLAWYAVRESRRESPGSMDWWGTALIAATLFLVSLALIQVPVQGWTGQVIAEGIAGIIAFILFITVELRARDPLVPFHIFRSPLVLGANLATLFLYAALSSVFFFAVLNLQQVQGMTPLKAGLALLPSVLLITFLSGYGGTLADRIGPRMPMVLGPLLFAAGTLVLLLGGARALYAASFLPGFALIGLGMSLVIAPLTKSAMAVEESFVGAASGVNNAVSRIAGLLAVAVLGAVAIVVFRGSLVRAAASLPQPVGDAMIAQSAKFGGISLPEGLDTGTKAAAENAMKTSFVHAFRVVMIITATLGVLASLCSAYWIRPKQH